MLMSLINQTLKELKKRNYKVQSDGPIPAALVQRQKAALLTRPSLVLIVSILVSIMIISWMAYLGHGHKKSTFNAKLSQTVADKTTALHAATQKTTTPHASTQNSAPAKITQTIATTRAKNRIVSTTLPAPTKVTPIIKTVSNKAGASDLEMKQRLMLAKQYQTEHKYKQAINTLNVPALWQDNHRKAIRLLTALLVKEKRYAQAQTALVRAHKRYPNDADFLYQSALLNYDTKNFSQALSFLQKADPDIVTHIQYYALSAQLYLRQKQAGMAASLYHQLLQQEPDNAKWWLGLGLALQAQQRISEAQNAYRNAKQLNQLPPNAVAYIEQQMQQTPYSPPV
jgi:MSHA biogenesis protein MshN